ncbi:glucan biosynthesis glucosyltransferase H [Sulfuriferula sp. AH1]|uniref:glucans biosynthesis glucosyltransferase MdoH n=1 Tax=Sulfuriferula sp. AH1 TaxID=1985873 RepID=UPI000B3B83A5|nr:glucans biosynthesis glucosyltransferase MdoH [Sulfuriferula sp. AH1]ARU31949.1 glucan biosynthesis glucosyltransferase H [Sulfuriferula sp. AH1]
MELHPATRLKNNFPYGALCELYLDRLPLSPERREAILTQLAAQNAASPREAITALHAALAGPQQTIDPDNPAAASIGARLALDGKAPVAETPLIWRPASSQAGLPIRPLLQRTTMAPLNWPPRFSFNLFKSSNTGPGQDYCPANALADDNGLATGSWQQAGTRRRLVLLMMTVVITYFTTTAMEAVLPYHGRQSLEIAILVLFAILSAWVTLGFWTALVGFIVQLTGGDRHIISAHSAANTPIGEQTRTAIIMPICNENVQRVFAGLRATYESLARTGELTHFDFFILSDSNDPDNRVAEVAAWRALCEDVNGFGRVFYRWRQHRIKRKSGNVADFCRRWGSQYQYMIVLDADSIMSGKSLTGLVRLMEANPGAGIIQSAPQVAGRDTFYARMQQFASRVYGPIFVAGLHYWQLGESHYWGHNAILRIEPFMRHCALGRLSGKGPLSGEILSHDFVEAALMRRAGWTVWIAYDLPGSYEEVPPNLVDELKRDRRWCQGNMMNFRLFLADGLHPAHRAVFMTGVAAYVSAPLWFLFLLLSTAQLAVHVLVEPDYFTQPFQLFPIWPQWNPERAMALFGATAALLFLPKILSVVLIWIRDAKSFGGWFRLGVSMVIEAIFSALLAPIRMLFHTGFVMNTLLGRGIKWKSPARENAETTWSEALRRHGWHTLLGLVWAAGVYWLRPSYLLWLSPIVGSLILSIPISVLSSRVSFGQWLRKLRLFLIPEELNPPEVLTSTYKLAAVPADASGFIDAVVHPATNALLCAAGAPRCGETPITRTHRKWVDEALAGGFGVLSANQKMHLLNDTNALSRLHFEVWTAAAAHPDWMAAAAQNKN